MRWQPDWPRLPPASFRFKSWVRSVLFPSGDAVRCSPAPVAGVLNRRARFCPARQRCRAVAVRGCRSTSEGPWFGTGDVPPGLPCRAIGLESSLVRARYADWGLSVCPAAVHAGGFPAVPASHRGGDVQPRRPPRLGRRSGPRRSVPSHALTPPPSCDARRRHRPL